MSGVRLRQIAAQEFNGNVGYNHPGQQWSKYSENIRGVDPDYIRVPSIVGGTSIATADNQAIIRALSAVRQQRTQFQGLTALGELRETIKQLKHPFKSAREYVDKYFKQLGKTSRKAGTRPGGGAKQLDAFLRSAADTWLEVAFGLKPLISDVKSAAEAIARYSDDKRRERVTGYGSDVKVRDGSAFNYWGSYSCVFMNERTTTTQSVRYRVTLDHTMSADLGSTQRMRELNGLTLEQFIPTAWELVPWSFLVDYFTNVGEVIQAGCTSRDDIKFVVRTDRLETIRYATYKVGKGPFNSDPEFWEDPGTIGKSTMSLTSVSRASTSLPLAPTLEISLPGSPMKYVNMLALWKSNERSLLSRNTRLPGNTL